VLLLVVASLGKISFAACCVPLRNSWSFRLWCSWLNARHQHRCMSSFFVLLLLFEDLIVLCLVLELFSLLSKEISCSSCRTRKHAIILGSWRIWHCFVTWKPKKRLHLQSVPVFGLFAIRNLWASPNMRMSIPQSEDSSTSTPSATAFFKISIASAYIRRLNGKEMRVKTKRGRWINQLVQRQWSTVNLASSNGQLGSEAVINYRCFYIGFSERFPLIYIHHCEF